MENSFDLTYFGHQERPAVRDQVTPYKVALLVLIEEFLKLNKRGDSGFSQHEEREIMVLMLQLVQSADLELKELYSKLEEVKCARIVHAMKDRLHELCIDGVSSLMDLLQSVPDELFQEPNALLHRNSVIGLYIRRLHLVFDKLTFSQVTKLHHRYKLFYDSWNSSKQCDYGLYGKLGGLATDLLDNTDSNGDASLSIIMARDDKDDEQQDIDINCPANDVGKYSQRQAELFIAQQAAMLQHNELEALPPNQLQQNIVELLNGNPELAEAHFLGYMNNLRVGEYIGALESLFHYFDRKLIMPSAASQPGQRAKQDDDINNRNFRYAALNMASLHYRFGHRKEALAALQEAIRMAQEFNDHICLQHALSWLQRLGMDSTDNTGYLLERLMSKAVELNMPYLMSLSIQAFSRHTALSTATPATVFELMLKSDILNCQHSQSSLMCSSYAQKSALWHIYGKREMGTLNNQLMLNLHTAEFGVYHNGEAECLGLCHLAMLHADQGMYDIAFGIIDSAKRRFPCNSQHSHIWILREQLLIFGRAVHHGKWAIAEQSVLNMKAVSSIEAKYCQCVLYKEKGEISMAFEIVQTMIQQCRDKKCQYIEVPELYVRLLILQSELYCATGNPTAASQPLLECITLCKNHHFSYMAALATLHLAFVQLCLGLPQHALALIGRVLIIILSHGSLAERAKAHYLSVKCNVAAAMNKNNPHLLKQVVLAGVQTMNDVISWFKCVEAFHRTKDSYYYQAVLYDKLGFSAERNRCSLQFKLLNQQYPTWNKAQVIHL